MMSPQGRSGAKPMYGYFLEETGMSSSVSFSSSFLREVACRDFEALALKRWMNAFRSLAFAAFFAFSLCRWRRCSWLAWYQKS